MEQRVLEKLHFHVVGVLLQVQFPLTSLSFPSEGLWWRLSPSLQPYSLGAAALAYLSLCFVHGRGEGLQ